ncbi:MAG: NYN domain-containing protein [Candidatus Aminicenantes bacterium]|nr:NYN domain-containing protein [Candidatus Aminicenantes bacterium]
MPYLIDGNNLIGHISKFNQGDSRSRFDLMGQLYLFQRATRKRLIVIFDGPADQELLEECRLWPKFELLFPRPGEKADDLILNYLQKTRQPRTIILVTSDRELQSIGRLRGAKLMTSQEFARQIRKVLKEKSKDRELRKPSFLASPLEIKLWHETLRRK